ncbi:hypothetical protein MCOL2_18504 [Listeria fleischmannii FSL S10-1203]|uniref:Uncharacterized protein n=1 Tax=Listeria fleischmannii FSL S10-1203 TaxID=1265822 RepID=W7D568_9LIST|nr:hypothetical protein MCOL2_18504 [Listeria fleischmannii FSL S10-1203]
MPPRFYHTYFLILVGNYYDGWLNGYAALIIYYVFNYTGTFLFNAFGRRMSAKKTFIASTFIWDSGFINRRTGSIFHIMDGNRRYFYRNF